MLPVGSWRWISGRASAHGVVGRQIDPTWWTHSAVPANVSHNVQLKPWYALCRLGIVRVKEFLLLLE